MGAVRKLTGVDKQVDAANKNTDAQVQATAQAAAQQQQALMASARAAADQQAQLAARSAAESKAATAASAPLETADVQLDPDASESAAGGKARRRAAFGRNYSTGVSV
jgi:hypothetical protein